jgi:glycosyltransferase involved in cell wall biosynthesis
VTGRLVDGENLEEITSAMSDYASSPEERKAVGSRGRLRALQQFRWDIVASQFLERVKI